MKWKENTGLLYRTAEGGEKPETWLGVMLLQTASATLLSQGSGLGARISVVTRAVATRRVYLILITAPWGELIRL